jgi:hypothetical protein
MNKVVVFSKRNKRRVRPTHLFVNVDILYVVDGT